MEINKPISTDLTTFAQHDLLKKNLQELLRVQESLVQIDHSRKTGQFQPEISLAIIFIKALIGYLEKIENNLKEILECEGENDGNGQTFSK